MFGYMKKTAFVAAVALATVPAAASALTTLSGTFNVTAVNATGLFGSESQATSGDLAAALALGTSSSDAFTYVGALDFGTSDGTDATTIDGWLSTGPGTVSGLDSTFGGLQLSAPNIGNGTATTTFFSFVRQITGPVDEFVVTHDDGVGIYDDGVSLGGSVNPTSVRETTVTGFDGGEFQLIYVATNGDPSVLNVAAVPLPAGGLLLLTALGGLGGAGALRRRRKAA